MNARKHAVANRWRNASSVTLSVQLAIASDLKHRCHHVAGPVCMMRCCELYSHTEREIARDGISRVEARGWAWR